MGIHKNSKGNSKMRGIFVSFLVCTFTLGACEFKFSDKFAKRHTFDTITFANEYNIRKNVNNKWVLPTVTFGDTKGILNDSPDKEYVGQQVWRSKTRGDLDLGYKKQWAIKKLLTAKVRADRNQLQDDVPSKNTYIKGADQQDLLKRSTFVKEEPNPKNKKIYKVYKTESIVSYIVVDMNHESLPQKDNPNKTKAYIDQICFGIPKVGRTDEISHLYASCPEI